MILELLLAAVGVALVSLTGALFFGSHRGLIGLERYVIPVGVGVFLSIVLVELIPETLAAAPEWGAYAVAFGFISFYILAQVLHHQYHAQGIEDCDRKSAATLLLIGDTIHNVADGVVLAGAFLIDPALGFATAVGLALHEAPQEIVEFGVLIRAGYSRLEAAWRNVLSASSIVVGALATVAIAQFDASWVWLLTGVAAGNLLFLAASDLLPRIHGNLKNYGNIWYATGAIVAGFMVMASVMQYVHETYGHGHEDVHSEELGEAARHE